MLKSLRKIDLLPGVRWPEPTAALGWMKLLAGWLLLALIAFALSRATVPTGDLRLAPFAMALFAAGLAAGRNAAALLAGCMAGALAEGVGAVELSIPTGCAAILAGNLAWSAAAPAIGRLRAARRRGPRIQARSPNRFPGEERARPSDREAGLLCAALAGLGTLGPGLVSAGGDIWPSIQAVTASLAALATSPLLYVALRVGTDRRCLLPEERAGLLLLAGMLAAGVHAICPPAAVCLGSYLIIMLAPVGSLAGAGLGAALALVSGDAKVAATMGIAGGAAQLCAGEALPLRACVPAASGAAALLLLGGDPWALAGALASAPLILLTPEAARSRLAGWAKPAPEGIDPDRLASELRQHAADRLRAMGEAFGELAEGYLTPGHLPDEQALLTGLREALCDGCPGYGDCWAGERSPAARLLCDLIAQAVDWSQGEAEGPLFDGEVPPDLLRRCRRGRLIPDRVGTLLEDFARARRSELKRGREDRLVAAQFLQARRLADRLAEEQSLPIKLRSRQAARAAGVLERSGIPVSDAMMLGGPRTELLLTLREGRWSASLAEAAAARLGRAFGRIYAPEGSWGQILRFVRQPRLRAEVGAASVSRQAGVPSGDSQLIAALDGDRLLALICDGMGSGASAARESACAARLLARFMAAGADWSLAVETANQLLLNASAEEMFSTVDMLILDLATGMAEFVKLAACPALVGRGSEVLRIEGGRLPLGILERVCPASARTRLLPGDVVLLASDGVMDAAPPGALEALLRDPGEDMNALAERVLAAAAPMGRDDMTALCLRLDLRAPWVA